MFGIGAGELVMILIAGLVIFGPGKLPEVGRAIGKGLREFRKAQAMFRATLDEVSLENEKKSVTLEKSPAENVSADKAVTTDKAVTADKDVTLDKNIAADKPAENVAVDKPVSVEKNVTADKAVTADKTITVEKALPLDNPAENISREKLVDAANKVFEEKKTAVNVDDVIQMAKDTSLAKPEDDSAKNEISAPESVVTAENVSTADKVATAENGLTAEKVTTADNADKNDSSDKVGTAEKKTAFNVYDIIEMAKNNSFVKEKVYEKIFGGTGTVTYNADVSKCINITRGGTDGTCQ